MLTKGVFTRCPGSKGQEEEIKHSPANSLPSNLSDFFFLTLSSAGGNWGMKFRRKKPDQTTGLTLCYTFSPTYIGFGCKREYQLCNCILFLGRHYTGSRIL